MDAGFPHLALITHSISAARRPAASHTSFSKYARLHATFIHLAEVNEMDGDGGEGDERCEVIALDVASRSRSRSFSLRFGKRTAFNGNDEKKSSSTIFPENICARCILTSVTLNSVRLRQFRVTCHSVRHFFASSLLFSPMYGKLNDDERLAGSEIVAI